MPQLERQDRVTVDEGTGYQRRERMVRNVSVERKQLLKKVSQFVWLAFTVLEILIGLRVVLKLVAAEPNNAFANFIYAVTTPFLQPFFGLTATPSTEGFVLEIPSLIGMVAYALLGWLLIRLIWLIFYQPSATVVSTYEKHRVD